MSPNSMCSAYLAVLPEIIHWQGRNFSSLVPFYQILLYKNIRASFAHLLVSLLFIYYSVVSHDSNFTFFLLFIFVPHPISYLVDFLSF